MIFVIFFVIFAAFDSSSPAELPPFHVSIELVHEVPDSLDFAVFNPSDVEPGLAALILPYTSGGIYWVAYGIDVEEKDRTVSYAAVKIDSDDYIIIEYAEV